MHTKPTSLKTKVARGLGQGDETTGAISTPIYQSATFRHPSLEQPGAWDYSRQGNPTRQTLEQSLAQLEGAQGALAFTSGMAALTAVLDLFSGGDRILLSEDLYGGTWRLMNLLAAPRGIEFAFVDTSKPQAAATAWTANTRLLLVETPSNPLMRITDLRAMADLAHSHKAWLCVDNTFLSPWLQRPLKLGADLVVHSATKFLAGHNDTLSGFVACAAAEVHERLRLIQKTTGAVLAPFDSWLVLRGMKTLALRMEQQQASARVLASRLAGHPAVAQVHYPGLEDHPGSRLNASQADGPGAMISFRLRRPGWVPGVLAGVELILFAESLGGTESLITFPWTQTHGAIPQDLRERYGVDQSLLRLSVGIEEVEDLWADLDQALTRGMTL